MHKNRPQQLLEVEDLCDAAKPDERSVMTYVASFFHAFSSQGMCTSLKHFFTINLLSDQAETVSRRVVKFAELMQSVWVSQNDYERRARAVCSPFFDNILSQRPIVHS